MVWVLIRFVAHVPHQPAAAHLKRIKFQKTKKCDEWNGMHHSIISALHPEVMAR